VSDASSFIYLHDRLWIDFCQTIVFIKENGRGGEI
jgi:hypothetical protein